MTFTCSICDETSSRICVRCTKDTCGNHLCDKCGACSDCCTCELKLEKDTDPENEEEALSERLAQHRSA
jgi:hypothetical protein